MSAVIRRFAPSSAILLALVATALTIGLSITWWSGDISAEIMRGIELGWSRSPAIAIGIASFLSVPFLARLTPSLRALFIPDHSAAETAARRARMMADPPRSFMTKAWIEIDGTRGRGLELTREIARIGHGADADLRLSGEDSDGVHALIRRTPEAEFVVIDLSGGDGPGLAVNGQRLSSATLRDGDTIALGANAVVFRRG